ncbi:hypothetical protein CR51_25035 [Caballeronia megalochromosomata]|jgi:hypothetical protein|nr:hypothetical protein CR51_25035 [Caballeronia megalochromosomata]
MSDPTYDPLRDPRTLVKSYHYIDLPGEPPDSKLWPGVNNIIKLRKHRDLVFDIKLKAGASYTLKTDQPESKYGRFYDTKRKLTVARTTFNDGEPMHIWVGRKFQGNLILVSEAKEIGRFPIRKMDCTGTCTNDPKDKPAPMIFVLHANKEVANITDAELARNLITLEGVLAKQPPSRALADALNRARRVPALASPHSELPFAVHSPELDPDDGATPTLHAFKVKQTSGPSVPDEVLSFFKTTARVFKFDEKNLNTLSCNFILGQFLGGLGTLADSFGKSAPLRGFWRRAFIIQRTATGEFILMFSTSTKERRLLGYLLGVYQTASHDIKIMTLVGGAGKFSATFKAMEGAALGSVSIASKLGKSMYIGLALDTLAWMKDYLYPDRPDDGKDL